MLDSAASPEGSSPSRSRVMIRRLRRREAGIMYVFVHRLIQHTKALMSTEEKLCIKVLRILQEMLIRTLDFDEKVSSISSRLKKIHYEEDKLHSCILLFVIFTRSATWSEHFSKMRFLLQEIVFTGLIMVYGTTYGTFFSSGNSTTQSSAAELLVSK